MFRIKTQEHLGRAHYHEQGFGLLANVFAGITYLGHACLQQADANEEENPDLKFISVHHFPEKKPVAFVDQDQTNPTGYKKINYKTLLLVGCNLGTQFFAVGNTLRKFFVVRSKFNENPFAMHIQFQIGQGRIN